MADYAVGPDRIRKAIQNREEPAIGSDPEMQPEEESQAFYYQKQEEEEPAETYSKSWDGNDSVINEHPEMNMDYLDYSDSVKQQLGGDPYSFDPDKEAQTLYQREESVIFNKFFQGQYDINRLPPKEAKAWAALKGQIQAKAYQRAKGNQENKIRLYNHKISEWKTVQEIRAKRLLAEGKEDQAAKVKGGIGDAGAISFIENSMDIPFDRKEEAKKAYLQGVESTPQRDSLINILNTFKEPDEETPTTEKPKEVKTEPVKKQESKTLTREQAVQFLKQANGDKNKARQLAKASGWVW